MEPQKRGWKLVQTRQRNEGEFKSIQESVTLHSCQFVAMARWIIGYVM